MDIDTQTLRRIRAYRTVHDPIVPYKPRQKWLESTQGHVIEGTVESRYKRIETAPTDEPIQTVTWPEVAAWYETASMDASMVSEEFVGIYQFVLKQHMRVIMGDGSENLLPSSFADRIPITDRHKELAEKQRESLKAEQDEHFITEIYDGIPFDTSGVPKAFWKQNTIQSTKTESGDAVEGSEPDSSSKSDSNSNAESEQIGLDMF